MVQDLFHQQYDLMSITIILWHEILPVTGPLSCQGMSPPFCKGNKGSVTKMSQKYSNKMIFCPQMVPGLVDSWLGRPVYKCAFVLHGWASSMDMFPIKFKFYIIKSFPKWDVSPKGTKLIQQFIQHDVFFSPLAGWAYIWAINYSSYSS